MKRQGNNQRFRAFVLTCAIFSSLAMLATIPAAAQDDGGAGLVVSGKASDKDLGLPIYPGAKPHKDPGENTDAARLGVWGGGMGFKLAVLKMESNDSPTQVAEFYKKALAKYGRVLDCTNGGASDQRKDGSSGALTCNDDKPNQGGMLFKAGTKEKQHLVAIDPSGSGTIFALVYVWAKGD